jgi:SapC.
MKQLLIYENIKPLTQRDHGEMSLKRTNDVSFARETNAIPLVGSEFLPASEEYPIVFTRTNEGIVPTAIVGIRDRENAYVTADGKWDARYIPAFVRRYPFVFGTDEKAETFTLMIDEAYPGLNKDGEGEKLFDGEGKLGSFVQQTVEFLKEYQMMYVRTREFGDRLDKLGLLDPVEVKTPLPNDPERKINGFFLVNREKLKALKGEQLETLLKNDELELIFMQMISLRNIDKVVERVVKAETPAAANA